MRSRTIKIGAIDFDLLISTSNFYSSSLEWKDIRIDRLNIYSAKMNVKKKRELPLKEIPSMLLELELASLEFESNSDLEQPWITCCIRLAESCSINIRIDCPEICTVSGVVDFDKGVDPKSVKSKEFGDSEIERERVITSA